MPRIEVMNIKFNLDSNAVDAAVYAALCDIPRGKRSGIVKELLHAALCEGEAMPLQIPEKTVSLVIRHNGPVQRIKPGSQSRKVQSEQIEHRAPAEAGEARKSGDIKEFDEFRSLIY